MSDEPWSIVIAAEPREADGTLWRIAILHLPHEQKSALTRALDSAYQTGWSILDIVYTQEETVTLKPDGTGVHLIADLTFTLWTRLSEEEVSAYRSKQ